MRQTLAIFRKDLKHLWPLGAVVAAILIFHGWIDLQMQQGFLKVVNTRFASLEPMLLLLAWWCLVGVLVQQERVPGDRQYWVSRPISRASIVAAKVLFLAIFICAPSFLAQSVVLSLTGFSAVHYLGSLVWNQAWVFVYFLLAAAFASVTRNFRQYAVASLVALLVAGFILLSEANSPGGQWMGVQWVAEVAVEFAVLVGGVAVLAIQYHSRRSALARSVLAATWVLALLLLCLPWWHAAFSLTAALGAHEDRASRIQVAFDPSASPTEGPAEDNVANNGPARLALPVRITGIPKDREITSERISITVQVPGVEPWQSAWLESNEIAVHTRWLNTDDWLPEDGLYWLSFDVPAAEWQRVKDKPANLRADVALTLFSAPATTKLPPAPEAFSVPEAGHCTLESMPQFTQIGCVNPFANRVSLGFRVKSHNGGQARHLSSCCEISYSPLPGAGRFSVWEDIGTFPPDGQPLSTQDEISAEVRRPVSFLERHLVVTGINLAQYEAPRSRP